MGKPDWEKPQGIDMAGNPRPLKGRVFLSITNSFFLKSWGEASSSAIVGGNSGQVGVITRSMRSNIFKASRLERKSLRWPSTYWAAVTSAPLWMRRSVSGWYLLSDWGRY